jgi:hypothetical protein
MDEHRGDDVGVVNAFTGKRDAAEQLEQSLRYGLGLFQQIGLFQ